MAAMFERAVSNFPEYEPEMLSLDPPVLVFEKFVRDDEVRPPPASPRPRPSLARPSPNHHPPTTNHRPVTDHRPPTTHHRQVEALIRHGDGRFVRSTASGGRQGDEFVPLTSDIRTSWTTWCALPLSPTPTPNP